MAEERLTPSSEVPRDDEASDLASGFLVGGGRFHLLRELGRGGMGIVWLVHDERLMAPAALKFLSRSVRANPVELNNLRQETKKSRMLSHPNIIRIYDLYEAPEEAAFISMEYVEGASLWTLRNQQPKRCFSWEYLQPLVKQLCAALEYAHGENVIHRDLKSANMLVDERQRLRLADFGISARAVDSPTNETGVRLTSGTVNYMSPQQVDGAVPKVTDDIYGLGATLYELLCGFPPFYENDIAYQVRHVLPQPLLERMADLELDSDIPPKVAEMVMACLAKNPDKRPQTAAEVMSWIELSRAPVAPILPAAWAPERPPAPPEKPAAPEKFQAPPPAAPPLPEAAPAPPQQEELEQLPLRESRTAQFIGIFAGIIGVGLAAWLAWTHLVPNLMIPPNGPLVHTNGLAQATNATPTNQVEDPLPVNKSVTAAIDLAAINQEQGLQEINGLDDAVTTPLVMDGKKCRWLASGARSGCYFQIASNLKSTNLMSGGIRVEYYADEPGQLWLQYDGVGTRPTPHYTAGGRVTVKGDQTWDVAFFRVRRALFRNGERGGADFRLMTNSRKLYIHRVALRLDE